VYIAASASGCEKCTRQFRKNSRKRSVKLCTREAQFFSLLLWRSGLVRNLFRIHWALRQFRQFRNKLSRLRLRTKISLPRVCARKTIVIGICILVRLRRHFYRLELRVEIQFALSLLLSTSIASTKYSARTGLAACRYAVFR